MFERFDFQGFVAIGNIDADAATGGQRHHLVSGEFTLVENTQHFPTDIAGRSDHCNFVTHRSLSERNASGPLTAENREQQRFYARNAVNTMFRPGESLRLPCFGTSRTASCDSTGSPVHPLFGLLPV